MRISVATRFVAVFFVPYCIMVGGCDSPPTQSSIASPSVASSSSSTSASPQAAKPTSGEVAVASISVQVINRAGLDAALEKHRGQVVLVDYWATWCLPCVQLFPHSVELQRKFAEKGLSVITVSLDDPDDDQPKVLEFLKSKSAVTENYISKLGASPKSMEAFDLPSSGVPCFKIYDRQGKLRETLSDSPGKIDEKIDEVVNHLLAER